MIARPALVLAAGASRRMGCCKLGLPFPPDETTLPLPDESARTVLGRVLCTARAAGCAPLWVTVRPPLTPELTATLTACPFARPVPAPLAIHGQAESLKAGLAALLRAEAEEGLVASGLMLLLGDQPLLPAALLREVWSWHDEEPLRAVAPAWEGQRGHPVIVPRAAWEDMLALTGDTGPRDLLANYRLRVRPTDGTFCVADIDTPAAYQAALTVK